MICYPNFRQKSETRFFSQTCSEANVILLASSVYFWLDWTSIYSGTHFHKNLLISKSRQYFDFLNGISNNLELLSFQKMYGLWGYLLKAKALAPINARRVPEGG